MIIASWNSGDVLDACLESIAAQNLPGGLETIVVDNASTDGTAEVLRRHGDAVRVIPNESNLGYSLANNQGALQARGRLLFFLNADTELLAPDTLERLADALERPGVAIAGPLLLYPDGSLQPSCAAHPSVGRALLVGSGLHRLLPDWARARVAPDHWSHDRPRETGWVKGAALAIRADVFHALGGFRSMPYVQEQDLAYRAQARGLAVRFTTAARVVHVGNHSGAQRWSDTERARHVAASELEFLAAHYSRPRATAIRAITGLALGARALVLGLRGHPKGGIYRAMARVYARGPRAGQTP